MNLALLHHSRLASYKVASRKIAENVAVKPYYAGNLIIQVFKIYQW